MQDEKSVVTKEEANAANERIQGYINLQQASYANAQSFWQIPQNWLCRQSPAHEAASKKQTPHPKNIGPRRTRLITPSLTRRAAF